MLVPDPFDPRIPRPEPAEVTLGEALSRLKDRYQAPFIAPTTADEARERRRSGLAGAATRVGAGALAAVNLPGELLDTILAFEMKALGATFEWPIATDGSVHVGLAHAHMRGAGPTPLVPSIGPISLGTSLSVLIHGLPAARVGDLGTAVSCGTFTPTYEITTGSSKVFIAGARAARVMDLTRHCGSIALPARAPTLASLAIGLVASTALDTIAVRSEQLAARTSRERSEFAAEDAAAELDPALAATLAADSKGHALAAAVHSSQATANIAAMFARLLVGKDPGLPQCIGSLTTGQADVLVGGFPVPASLTLIKLGITKPLSLVTRDNKTLAAFKQLVRGLPTHGRSQNALPAHLCTFTGHPVDVITGSLVFTATDLDLPGAPALRLDRRYSSTWSARPSPLGRGWSHSLDEAVWREHDQLVYRSDDGRELELPLPTTIEPIFIPLHRLTLRADPEPDHWHITTPDGLTRHFAPLPNHPNIARLLTRRDRQGRTLHLTYDDQARLTTARTDDGREIHLHYDPNNHLTRIDLPDPDPGTTHFIPHIHYTHHQDDLTEIHDALGQVTRYRHDDHRIIEETLPGGLRFHFAYDGPGSRAACVRTWGDGGILDHRLVFDRPRRTTLVINACDETTTYRADERGLVTEIVDPRGAVTRHQYDELLRLVATTDPLGHLTRLTHDPRGNLIRHEAPDGALTLTTFHPTLDLPLERVGPAGAVDRWTWDPQGRLLRHTDPLGRSTVHHHDLSEGTSTIVHPDGRSERHRHDRAGRLIHLQRSDGSTVTHHHDRRGRLIRSTDDRGRSETRDHDLLGRLTRHQLPSGDLRLYTHDPRGRTLRATDPRGELHCSYTGLGWLASCGSAAAPPITLERDREGRISRVAGPTGTLLRIERDPAGRVRSTVDALGHPRRFTRDLLGRVTEIRRPDGQHTRYARDPAGRIVALDHGDGTLDNFTYRSDGALQTAIRQYPDRSITTTRRELDALGRLTREHQDEHSLTCEYDPQGRLARLRSSLGADLRFLHDDRGLARLDLPHAGAAPWSLHIERDRDGHEQARHLPGELLGWWHRDPHGRPQEHGLVASRPPQIFRHRRYHWDGPRLHIDETTRRRLSPHLSPEPSTHIWRHTHNHAGELTRSTREHGPTLEYRHDALGRRITRARDGLVTRWLWHGDVLLHQWTHPHDVITWAHEPGRPAPLARITAATRHAVVTDHLGSPLALLDDRGQLAWSAELGPHDLPRPVRGDPALCPFRHPGQLADPDTGLHHNRLRDLDPATGRYLTADPLGLLGGLDLHAHVDDPLTQTDILGLTPDLRGDLPHGVHARIAAELVADFPLHDLPPHLAELARRPGLATDRQTGIASIYATPPRAPCE